MIATLAPLTDLQKAMSANGHACGEATGYLRAYKIVDAMPKDSTYEEIRAALWRASNEAHERMRKAGDAMIEAKEKVFGS